MKAFHPWLAIVATSLLAACPTTVVRDHRTPPPPPPPAGPVWDSNGWTLLGQGTVNGGVDRDVIQVGGAAAGRFDKLTMVVLDSDLELTAFNIRFGNDEVFSPPVRAVFNEGSRTRVIDLPGENRAIKSIEIVYGNLPGGGRARVEIWGKDTGTPARPPVVVEPPPPPPPPVPAEFDPTGWTLLGSQTVEGKKDRDIFPVGKRFGIFDKLTIVVKDSDLELTSLVVNFVKGGKFEPTFREVFKEGTRSRVVDLPGDNRLIRNIAVRYRNLPGGGRARVEIYARDSKANNPSP